MQADVQASQVGDTSGLSALKGGHPVTNSKRTTPRLHQSTSLPCPVPAQSTLDSRLSFPHALNSIRLLWAHLGLAPSLAASEVLLEKATPSSHSAHERPEAHVYIEPCTHQAEPPEQDSQEFPLPFSYQRTAQRARLWALLSAATAQAMTPHALWHCHYCFYLRMQNPQRLEQSMPRAS